MSGAAVAFDPATYVDLARELHGQANQDGAALRAGISRAYYGAFLMARNHYGLDSSGMDGHKRVKERYEANHRNPACQSVASALVKLKQLRQQADYADSSNCTMADGKTAIDVANTVLKLLPSIPKPAD